MKLINIGFGNMVAGERVIALVAPDSAPIKRLVQDARDGGRVIDATCGKRTRTVLMLDSGHVVLSALQAVTVAARFGGKAEREEDEVEEL